MGKTTEERIKAEAEAYANRPYYKAGILKRGYIAGATAENTRFDPIIKVLEEIAESNCDYESTGYVKSIHSTECNACKAKEALEQWRGTGKEVITEDQANALLNPPEDNSPKGMPLPAPDSFTNPTK